MSNELARITPSTLLALSKGGDGATFAREAIKEAPEMALAVIARGNFTGLTVVDRRIAAVATDEVIGAVGKDSLAISYIDGHLTESQQVEMLAWWGDRFSALAELVSPGTLISALAAEIEEEGTAMAAVIIRAWANKLKDRPDWNGEKGILNMHIAGGNTFREILVAAMVAEGDEGWDAVGLDYDEIRELVDELPEDLLAMTAGDLAEARHTFRSRREGEGELPEPTEGQTPTSEEVPAPEPEKGDTSDV